MSAADYLAAVGHQPAGPGVGRVTDAPWDSRLAPTMREHDVMVSEERVAELLIDELAHHHAIE
jgi:hypothetical protein